MLEKFIEVARDIRLDSKGWIVCLAVLLITTVRSGPTYSFGIFFVKLKEQFNSTLVEEDGITTIATCVKFITAPISVEFCHLFGDKGYRIGGILGSVFLSISTLASSFVTKLEFFFLTHSILYGVGSSLIFMSASIVIGQHFDKNHKYHVTATAILLIGYPLGGLLYNPINAWLIETYSWQIAFRVASVQILIVGTICSWNFVSKEESNKEPVLEEDHVSEHVEKYEVIKTRDCCTWREIMKRQEILCWYLGNLISFLVLPMPFINLAHYMHEKKINLKDSSLVMTILSLSELICYLIASVFGNRLKNKLIYVNIISSAFLAVNCLLWPLLDFSYEMIMILSIVTGAFTCLSTVYKYAASQEVTGLDTAWPYTILWTGIGILLGPFFYGLAFDINQSFTDVFYVMGVIYILATFIYGAIPVIQLLRNQKKKINDVENIHMSNSKLPPQRFLQDLKTEKSENSLIEGSSETTKVKQPLNNPLADLIKRSKDNVSSYNYGSFNYGPNNDNHNE